MYTNPTLPYHSLPYRIHHPQHKLEDTEARLETAEEKLQISEFERKWAAGTVYARVEFACLPFYILGIAHYFICHLGTDCTYNPIPPDSLNTIKFLSFSRIRYDHLIRRGRPSFDRRRLKRSGYTDRDKRQAFYTAGLACVQRTQ